jgi:hypothetical protein
MGSVNFLYRAISGVHRKMLHPVSRRGDEAYFAQATKQMIETGDYVDIRYQARRERIWAGAGASTV